MPDIKITIKNLPQIKAAFGKAPRLMTQELNKAIAKTVYSIQNKEGHEYKALGIRRITGGLINSIVRGSYLTNLRGEVGPNVTGSPGVDYALYVHSGTRFMRARPFLLNAVNQSEGEIDKFFQEAVQSVLDDIGRGV